MSQKRSLGSSFIPPLPQTAKKMKTAIGSTKKKPQSDKMLAMQYISVSFLRTGYGMCDKIIAMCARRSDYSGRDTESDIVMQDVNVFSAKHSEASELLKSGVTDDTRDIFEKRWTALNYSEAQWTELWKPNLQYLATLYNDKEVKFRKTSAEFTGAAVCVLRKFAKRANETILLFENMNDILAFNFMLHNISVQPLSLIIPNCTIVDMDVYLKGRCRQIANSDVPLPWEDNPSILEMKKKCSKRGLEGLSTFLHFLYTRTD